MSAAKTDLITFKVEAGLAEILNRMPNKSEFIRNAVLSSLSNTCPLCQGIGVLTPKQREHWSEFSTRHHVERCHECNEVHIACDAGTV